MYAVSIEFEEFKLLNITPDYAVATAWGSPLSEKSKVIAIGVEVVEISNAFFLFTLPPKKEVTKD